MNFEIYAEKKDPVFHQLTDDIDYNFVSEFSDALSEILKTKVPIYNKSINEINRNAFVFFFNISSLEWTLSFLSKIERKELLSKVILVSNRPVVNYAMKYNFSGVISYNKDNEYSFCGHDSLCKFTEIPEGQNANNNYRICEFNDLSFLKHIVQYAEISDMMFDKKDYLNI